jgi:hypothetical protein
VFRPRGAAVDLTRPAVPHQPVQTCEATYGLKIQKLIVYFAARRYSSAETEADWRTCLSAGRQKAENLFVARHIANAMLAAVVFYVSLIFFKNNILNSVHLLILLLLTHSRINNGISSIGISLDP